MEYKPSEFGYAGSSDHRGRYRAAEGLVFLSYGLTDWLAVEFEAAVIRASLWKSSADGSLMPAKLSESGPGDRQAQLDFRLLKENEHRPELFGFFEVVFPSNRKKNLIGTADWELKGGGGVIRGFRWGTLTVRAAMEHSRAERKTELGEYAIEYLRRLSPGWRLYTGVEGTQDEVEFITEFQWHLSDRLFIRINNGFGLTSKATDWAPDVGIVFSVPTR